MLVLYSTVLYYTDDTDIVYVETVRFRDSNQTVGCSTATHPTAKYIEVSTVVVLYAMVVVVKVVVVVILAVVAVVADVAYTSIVYSQ